MYRSILVPLDGSPTSEQALPIASALTGRCGATIHLAHVHTPYGPIISIDGMPVIDEQLRSLARDHDLAYPERTRERLQSLTSSPATCALLEPTGIGDDEDIPAMLTRHATAIKSDLIAMTVRERLRLADLLARSVSNRVLRKARVPALLYHPQVRDEHRGRRVSGLSLAPYYRPRTADGKASHACAGSFPLSRPPD